jgi:hypothetical protein
MRAISGLFSLQSFVVSLVSISTLATTYALPVDSESVALFRRNGVTVAGKTGKLGKQLSPASHAKSTVHRLDHWDGHDHPGHVIKQYASGKLSNHEVNGLKAVGQHVHSDPHTGKVVMKEMPGRSLAHMVGDVHDHAKRKEFVDHWKPKVAAAAAHIAKTKGVLHGDLNMNNILVHNHPEHGEQIHFIDWEHHHEKGSKEFTDDHHKIHSNLNMVWDSTATPPEAKKSKSPGKR